MSSKNNKTIYRIRVDEDGALAKSCDFNRLLVANDVMMETEAGNSSR